MTSSSPLVALQLSPQTILDHERICGLAWEATNKQTKREQNCTETNCTAWMGGKQKKKLKRKKDDQAACFPTAANQSLFSSSFWSSPSRTTLHHWTNATCIGNAKTLASIYTLIRQPERKVRKAGKKTENKKRITKRERKKEMEMEMEKKDVEGKWHQKKNKKIRRKKD